MKAAPKSPLLNLAKCLQDIANWEWQYWCRISGILDRLHRNATFGHVGKYLVYMPRKIPALLKHQFSGSMTVSECRSIPWGYWCEEFDWEFPVPSMFHLAQEIKRKVSKIAQSLCRDFVSGEYGLIDHFGKRRSLLGGRKADPKNPEFWRFLSENSFDLCFVGKKMDRRVGRVFSPMFGADWKIRGPSPVIFTGVRMLWPEENVDWKDTYILRSQDLEMRYLSPRPLEVRCDHDLTKPLACGIQVSCFGRWVFHCPEAMIRID